MIKSFLSVVDSVFLYVYRVSHMHEGPLTIPTFVFRAYIIRNTYEWRITHYGACIRLHRLSMLCHVIVESVYYSRIPKFVKAGKLYERIDSNVRTFVEV